MTVRKIFMVIVILVSNGLAYGAEKSALEKMLQGKPIPAEFQALAASPSIQYRPRALSGAERARERANSFEELRLKFERLNNQKPVKQ